MMRRIQDHFSPFVRFLMGGQAVVNWYGSITNPDTPLYYVALTDDGNVLVWVMGLLGAVLLLDLFVNDWSPEFLRLGEWRLRLTWPSTWRHRHYILVGIAFCYAAQPYIAERAGQSVALMIVCYWYGLMNMAAAFLDAGERSRRLWWQKACS